MIKVLRFVVGCSMLLFPAFVKGTDADDMPKLNWLVCTNCDEPQGLLPSCRKESDGTLQCDFTNIILTKPRLKDTLGITDEKNAVNELVEAFQKGVGLGATCEKLIGIEKAFDEKVKRAGNNRDAVAYLTDVRATFSSMFEFCRNPDATAAHRVVDTFNKANAETCGLMATQQHFKFTKRGNNWVAVIEDTGLIGSYCGGQVQVATFSPAFDQQTKLPVFDFEIQTTMPKTSKCPPAPTQTFVTQTVERRYQFPSCRAISFGIE